MGFLCGLVVQSASEKHGTGIGGGSPFWVRRAVSVGWRVTHIALGGEGGKEAAKINKKTPVTDRIMVSTRVRALRKASHGRPTYPLTDRSPASDYWPLERRYADGRPASGALHQSAG